MLPFEYDAVKLPPGAAYKNDIRQVNIGRKPYDAGRKNTGTVASFGSDGRVRNVRRASVRIQGAP